MRKIFNSTILIFVLTLYFSPASAGKLLNDEMFRCPMKCEAEKTYNHKGTCPVCKMDLEEITEEPWTEDQLMDPAVLANLINDPKAKKPVILSIGPGGGIKGSVEFGAAKDKNNLEAFRAELTKMDKNSDLVIYCGCCPFAPCPNIRPAFSLIREMKFTNAKLLNLSHNLKVDWVDKGYPVE